MIDIMALHRETEALTDIDIIDRINEYEGMHQILTQGVGILLEELKFRHCPDFCEIGL